MLSAFRGNHCNVLDIDRPMEFICALIERWSRLYESVINAIPLPCHFDARHDAARAPQESRQAFSSSNDVIAC